MPGCIFFDFLFPLCVDFVSYDRCNQCNHQAKSRPLNVGKKQLLTVPLPDIKEREDEDLQTLVDATKVPYNDSTQCLCSNDNGRKDGEDKCDCKAIIGRTSQAALIIQGDILIVQLQRLGLDIPDPTVKKQAVPYKHNNRRVAIPLNLNVPSLNGMRLGTTRYSLSCTIQHKGGISKFITVSAWLNPHF